MDGGLLQVAGSCGVILFGRVLVGTGSAEVHPVYAHAAEVGEEDAVEVVPVVVPHLSSAGDERFQTLAEHVQDNTEQARTDRGYGARGKNSEKDRKTLQNYATLLIHLVYILPGYSIVDTSR